MAYYLNYTDEFNKGVIIVEERSFNDDNTSLRIPGKGYVNYGEMMGENLLHMLENFAFSSAPLNPVEGQTWYNTTDGVDQLMIYDGTRWSPASGIFKASASPAADNAVAGDLWADTASQQLYLSTGSGWLLVGPEFSQGSSTGPRVTVLAGTDNVNYPVLIIDVDNVPVTIFSVSQFRPKSAIDGFRDINVGINLSTKITPAGTFKFRGLAETAESLRIQNKDIPAINFLRSDIDTTANGIFSVRNNQGIKVGESSQLTLQTSGQRGLIVNNSSGAGTDFQVKRDTDYKTVLRLNSDNASGTSGPVVGVNNLRPEETLDITGTLGVSSTVKVNSTAPATALNEGALQVAGGASIAKSLYIGEDLKVTGKLTIAGDVIGPGNTTSKISGYNSISASRFVGNLLGNVIGAVEGNASSATKLISTTSFALTGDVSSAPVLFDGNASAPKEFNTVLSNTFISSKDEATLVDGGPLRIDSDDELLIDRPSAGLYKIKQRDLVASVPINPTGIFVPYGGAVAPPGWLLCDGSIVSQSMYTDLFNVIGHSFLDTAELVNLGLSSTLVFGLPDFRGRFPLGLDGMGGTAANRVTDNAADTLGNSGGNQTADVKKENLPEHQHDMQSDAGEQFYAIRNITSNTSADPQEIALNLSPGSNIATGIATSGDIDDGGFFDQSPTKGYRTVAGEELGAPLTTMNPYTAVNYIIWTGSV